MSIDQLTLIGIIAAALVVLGGMLVRRANSRRYLLFVLAVNIVLLVTVLIAGWLPPERYPIFKSFWLLAPVVLGVQALVLLHCKEYLELRRAEKTVALALGLISIALLIVLGSSPGYLGGGAGGGTMYGVLAGAAMLATVWMLAGRFPPTALVFVAASLAMLGSCNAEAVGARTQVPLPAPPDWLSFPLQLFFLFVLPGLVPATAAVLVWTALKPRAAAGRVGLRSLWPAAWRLLLAAVLLSYLTYTLVWGAIWDQTVDMGWGGILAQTAGFVVVPAGMVMAATSINWRRLAGLAFAVLVPLAISGATAYGGSISHHALTESRAVRIEAAVEHFHGRTGTYPAALNQLVPNELWWIPGPVILGGQGWCYQGGTDFYRLGAVFQEFWGRPLSIRLYASAGSPPQTPWECDEKLAELKPLYEPQPATETPGAVPTPAPATTSPY